jgi:hypothetical protein
MTSGRSRTSRRYFRVEEANRMLPLVERIVGDVVRQWETVQALEHRLSAVSRKNSSRAGDLYAEEVAQSQAEFEREKARLSDYIEELNSLGVELKGFDGLCDFPSLRDGREVYLCWRLGEPQVAHWHEVRSGFAGRQPIDQPREKAASGSGGKGAR